MRKEGHNGHYRNCFKSLKDKKWNSACPLQNENEQNVKGGAGGCRTKMELGLEREGLPSL